MARKNLYPPSVTPGIPKLGQKPAEWIETTLGDVLQVVQRRVKMDDNKEYQLVTAKRNRGGIVPRSVLKGRDILTKTQFYIKSGDFLISRRQIIHGACGVVPPELEGAIVSNEYSTLRVKEGLLLEFLRYFCHTTFFQQTCFQASVGVDVEKMIFDLKEWLKYRIYLPPISEQREIAEILCTWDEAITLTERLIAAKQRRKKALMQQLLTGRRRFREFEGEEWSKVRLGKLGDISSGIGFPLNYQGKQGLPILFIKVSDMNLEGNEKYIQSANNTIDEITVRTLGATILQPGTLVFPKVGAALLTNKRRMITRPTAIDNNLMAIKPTNIAPEYLYY